MRISSNSLKMVLREGFFNTFIESSFFIKSVTFSWCLNCKILNTKYWWGFVTAACTLFTTNLKLQCYMIQFKWLSWCLTPPPRTVFPGIPFVNFQGIPGKTGPWGQGRMWPQRGKYLNFSLLKSSTIETIGSRILSYNILFGSSVSLIVSHNCLSIIRHWYSFLLKIKSYSIIFR